LLLSVIGTISATLGMLTMWAQPSAKRTLAWSTVSQMGFMMAECGTGAFAAAALHVVGHGFYKAWSFLRVGDVPQPVQGTALQPRQSLALCALGSLFGLAATAYFSLKRGLDPLRTPAEMALILMLALSIGQIWVGCWSAAPAGPRRNPMAWMAALALSLAVAVVAVPVYGGAIAFFAPVFGVVPAGDSALSWVAALLPIVALAGLSVVHALLPLLYETQPGRAFCVHVLNGFYVGTIADRVVSGPWENKGQRNGLLEKMNRA
jgi:NAD(P)H-quinone oxidoreductase subunit 5